MKGAPFVPPSFGVSQFTTAPWTFDEDLARLPMLGIGTIEIVEDKLDAVRWEAQMHAVAERGLVVSGFQPSVRTVLPSRMMPDPTNLTERKRLFRRSIERLAPFAAGAPFMISTGVHSGGDMAEAMRITAAMLDELAAVAGDNGVTLALEPLSPTSMNIESMIWTVDQALMLIDSLGRPEVGLCLDFWNVWQNAALGDAIGRAGGRILTVQLGGWRTPRSFADRVALGESRPPLGPLIYAVRATGYRGPYVLELFHDDVPDAPHGADIAAIIERSRDAFNAALSPVLEAEIAPPVRREGGVATPDRR